jgi:flavin-dependent dehydrogenase
VQPPSAVDTEVLIAGAGPAGIATAVALARRRPDLANRGAIICLDRATFPREKPCGGGLTGHAQAGLQALGLEVRVPAIPCRTGQIVFQGASEMVRLQAPVDIIRRNDFDADLVVQARAQGVVIIEGESVTAHDVDAEQGVVRVRTSAGRELGTRVLVAADGAGSRVRQSLLRGDPHAPQRPLRLFKHELTVTTTPAPCMIYDFSPMEEGLRGYVWLFPVSGNRLNVGAMHYPSRRLSGAEIERILARTLRRHGVELPRTARGWPAWPYAPRARIAGRHVLCVGDAAGIDALTGEGIAVGLEHGPIAASQIHMALESRDYSFSRYRQAIARATVGRELALDGTIASRLYARGGFRYWLSLVMFDARVRELYAARVCGSLVLADRKRSLLLAFARHLITAPLRIRKLERLRDTLDSANGAAAVEQPTARAD